MSKKQEPTSPHNCHSHALNAVEQLCRETRLTWDTYNHSQRVAQLESMAHLIAHVIEQQVDEWEAQL